MEQVNKYTRNGRRRYCRVFTWLSEIESVESKVENEMLSVRMRLTKAIRWSQVKSRDDAAAKLDSNEVKKALAEVTQLLEVHQTKERLEVLEKPQEHNKENGKDDNDELRNIAAKFQQDGRNFAQDL